MENLYDYDSDEYKEKVSRLRLYAHSTKKIKVDKLKEMGLYDWVLNHPCVDHYKKLSGKVYYIILEDKNDALCIYCGKQTNQDFRDITKFFKWHNDCYAKFGRTPPCKEYIDEDLLVELHVNQGIPLTKIIEDGLIRVKSDGRVVGRKTLDRICKEMRIGVQYVAEDTVNEYKSGTITESEYTERMTEQLRRFDAIGCGYNEKLLKTHNLYDFVINYPRCDELPNIASKAKYILLEDKSKACCKYCGKFTEYKPGTLNEFTSYHRECDAYPDIDIEYLRKLHTVDKIPLKKIVRLGLVVDRKTGRPMTYQHLTTACENNNIPTMTREDLMRDIDVEKLIDLYVNKKFSTSWIASQGMLRCRRSGCVPDAEYFKKVLIENGIELRSVSETKRLSLGYGDKKRLNPKGIDWGLVAKQYTEGMTTIELSQIHDISLTPLLNHLKRMGVYRKQRSSHEMLFKKFLDECGVEYKQSDRKLIQPRELDFVIPSQNLAVEIDGVYWHSADTIHRDGRDSVNYHYSKTLECAEQGITLVHFLDVELEKSFEIVKSMMRARLGIITDKLMARECVVREVSVDEARHFLNEHHLQGFISSKIYIGLYKDNELITMISMGKSRFNHSYDWEIYRYSTRINTIVNGGFAKMFRYFIDTYKPSSVITYADARYSEGAIYRNNGFTFLKHSTPNYFYVHERGIQYSRYQCQKHKLKYLLPDVYDENLSEREIMKNAGFYRIYDCGNYSFEWKP